MPETTTEKPPSFYARERTMFHGLTRRGHEIFSWMFSFTMENGFQPSYKDVCDHFGFKSPSNMKRIVIDLQNHGFVVDTKKNDARCLRFLKTPDNQPFKGFILKP